MYNIEIKVTEKIFIITMRGNLTDQESLDFLAEYAEKVNTIVSTEYTCVIDIFGLKATSPYLVAKLIKGQELMMKNPFKIIYSIMPESGIVSSQIEKVGKDEYVLDNTIIVNNYRDILKLVNL